MHYVVGFTRSPGQPPFRVVEGEGAPPHFSVGAKFFIDGSREAPEWLQVTSVAYQMHPSAFVTTVVVGEVTSVGGEGEEFALWPW